MLKKSEKSCSGDDRTPPEPSPPLYCPILGTTLTRRLEHVPTRCVVVPLAATLREATRNSLLSCREVFNKGVRQNLKYLSDTNHGHGVEKWVLPRAWKYSLQNCLCPLLLRCCVLKSVAHSLHCVYGSRIYHLKTTLCCKYESLYLPFHEHLRPTGPALPIPSSVLEISC